MHSQAGVYDSHAQWGMTPPRSHRERIEQTLELVPSDVESVLDAGCGDGAVSNALVDRGMRVVGVDISSVALRHFRGHGSIASLDALPFRDASFDLVLCSEVLEHLPDALYPAALRELGRVTKRYVLVTVPFEEHLPRQHVLCATCGHAYHRDYHMRSFGRGAVETLFPGFTAASTALIGRRRSNALVVWLQHALLRSYRKRGYACPQCGDRAPFVPDRGPVWTVLKHGVRLLGKILPRNTRAHWIATLFRCDGTA